MKIVLITGGFDPIHSGHINYIKAAKELGDYIAVGLNSDAWLVRKKGKAFMPYSERLCVLDAIGIDWVFDFDDSDGSAIDALHKVKNRFPDGQIIFANGGDRNATNIPETIVPDVLFKFGVGGNIKMNSSSWLLDEWKAPKIERIWGYYRVLHEVPGTKVKELTVMPGKTLSLQRHMYRHEFWHVTSGKCCVEQRMKNGYALPIVELNMHKEISIPINEWHRIYNPFEEPCKIVEIQYGEQCNEEDIERYGF
jgi:D-beta-D-heptose 7-phosphate kinase/D-beta-D-heptose 1-phosphate adenosyltransferase